MVQSTVDSGTQADALLDEIYHHRVRLAVYGSLAPGKANHHLLARYGGDWSNGRVRGALINAGWGAAGGFPGLVPRTDGPWVTVHVLQSNELPDAWPELDAFEGVEYRRVLIPVYGDDTGVLVKTGANIYEIAH